MDLIFSIGYQKYFLDQFKMSKEHLEKKSYFKSIISNPANNYTFFISYAFTKEEYAKRGNGLPECILNVGDSTFIPRDIHFRSKVGNIAVCHLSGNDIFAHTNPNIEGIILDIVEVCDRINADEGDRLIVGKKGENWSPIEKVQIFSWTQDAKESVSLINGLERLGLTKKYRLIIY